MSLISLDAPGRRTVEEATGHLGSAPDLVRLREPTAVLGLVPRHVLQQTAPEARPVRIRRLTRGAVATLAIHAAFAAAFVALLTWRPTPPAREVEIPVEVVTEEPPPKPAPQAEAPKPEPPKPEPAKPLTQQIPQPPLPPAPAPDPHPPAPPVVQPPPQADAPAPSSPLRAPPPEPTRAKTDTRTAETPNSEPDTAEAPKATHEAKPPDAPKVLSTSDARAAFAVPKPEVAKPQRAPAPAPDAPKTPSETDKLAAVLPTDMTALPETFRAVLSGNGAAVDAAYKGLVFGRFGRSAAEISERARQQNLKGQVIVAFTLDDDGGIKSLAVLQSSGNPAVDALGLEMIRSAAPFPPPPPGAPRSFTPALAFGD